MKQKTYTQCRLFHPQFNRETTSWIPTQFAKVGNFLKLHEEDGWQVKEVGTTLDEDSVLIKERDYLKQRDASDI